MSSDVMIRFAKDMPAAAVEVVAPDLEVVDRFMLDAGRFKQVQIPSERSFLRVHLPSGQVATIKELGNERSISLETIFRRESHLRIVIPMAQVEMVEREKPERKLFFQLDPINILDHWRRADLIESHGIARILSPNNNSMPEFSLADGGEAHWEMDGNDHPEEPLKPLTLRIQQPQESVLDVRLPGNIKQVWARSWLQGDQDTLKYWIRFATLEPTADTIMGFLQRGDFYSAESMKEWIEDAAEMLLYKKRDPYAAAEGAYLLLRLKQFSRLHDWAKNLADWFPFLPDGCVIWAWQLIQKKDSKKEDIQKYLFEAVNRGLPIYSVGLRLLIDGLHLLGDDGQEMLQKVLDQAGVIVWNSPLTASIHTIRHPPKSIDTQMVVYDIAFDAKV